MSVDIIFNQQFIKIEDKFIPVIQWGSNNLFNYDGSISRSWSNYGIFGYGEKTEKELYGRVDQIITSYNENRDEQIEVDELKKNLGWYIAVKKHSSKTLSYNQLKNIIKKGIKEALTIEEMKENNITVYASNTAGKNIVTTTKNLIEQLNNNSDMEISYSPDIYIELYQKTLKKKRVRTVQNFANGEYVIHILEEEIGEAYFMRNLKYGFKYTYFKNDAKKYDSRKKAETALSNFKNKVSEKYSKSVVIKL